MRAYLRLRPQLVERLKADANRQHVSFNSYVEGILLDFIYNVPNEETVEAIEESKRGEYAGTIDLSNMEAFKRSMGI
jgi:hypothetical protein